MRRLLDVLKLHGDPDFRDQDPHSKSDRLISKLQILHTVGELPVALTEKTIDLAPGNRREARHIVGRIHGVTSCKSVRIET